MSRYELGFDMNYVRHWGISEAVREFFQNARDEEVEHPENKMLFDYNKEEHQLIIGNKNSVLNINTLLLGKTTKADNSDTIGQFGEGYKVATVVLLRNNCGVTIYNNKAGEVWTAKKVKSRRYGEVIPVFDITKTTSWFKPKKSKEDLNLVVVIDGIFEDDFETIKRNMLVLRDYGESYEDPSIRYGKVLLDESEKGRVYSNGLYVCTEPSLSYGYDLHSSEIPLGRDRNLTDSFKLRSACKTLIVLLCPSEFIVKNLGIDELKYFDQSDFWRSDSKPKRDEIIEKTTNMVIKKYGDTVVPVDSEEDFNKIAETGRKPCILNKATFSFLDMSRFKNQDVLSLDDRFDSWIRKNTLFLSGEAVDELKSMWREARNVDGVQQNKGDQDC